MEPDWNQKAFTKALFLNLQLESAKAECNMRHQHLLVRREGTHWERKKEEILLNTVKYNTSVTE